MNNYHIQITRKIILGILGGIDAVIYMFTPLLISIIWASLRGLDEFGSYFFYIIGALATVFRAIKIGWMKGGQK